MLESRESYHPKSDELKKGYKAHITFESGYETAFESEYKKDAAKWSNDLEWLEKHHGKVVKKEIKKV